jgi:hypothetical protein
MSIPVWALFGVKINFFNPLSAEKLIPRRAHQTIWTTQRRENMEDILNKIEELTLSHDKISPQL